MFNKVMTKAIEWKLKLENDVRGVTAVEYAIIAVAMSAIILVVFKNGTLKETLNTAMTNIKTALDSAAK
ncbi:Flp family type IVb pilin [Vibrio vulnificus]|uniref:Flp family type IVb pilin n=1 Tax=Vibrio vulnificus TaxID=672 RepID=UPI0005F2550B|nr:Flp family type IVb pilin [Vibrio vulnificus]EGQ7758081.1 Flp family type IVb pilin [Vibrio vulnificus]EGQ7965025.1 Flp family type IVb pilin [Vibrio vulnificus]EGR1514447.1 Flp family type IVb pilin [Vibrio vulnificus]EHH0751271.1 Flp family type IVb pilin [Vibrio vulnificus]EHH2449617.1 Flp family type IVb pilin [Vibrio vulnificus]